MKQAKHQSAARRTKATKSRNTRKRENGREDLGSIIAAVRSEGDRLKQLADKLEAREKADAEMRKNYPFFKKVTLDYLLKEFRRDRPPLPPNADLKKIAREEGAVTIEEILADLESIDKGA